jgi:GntR family transcriptional regulator
VDDGRPIFVQIAEHLSNEIINGTLPEESRVPSINELAAFHRINPATALKGVSLLVDDGVLYKQRGIGMFIATGARAQLLAQRRQHFSEEFVKPLLAEAKKLGINPVQLSDLIGKELES